MIELANTDISAARLSLQSFLGDRPAASNSNDSEWKTLNLDAIIGCWNRSCANTYLGHPLRV
jgi:hypothetical protein